MNRSKNVHGAFTVSCPSRFPGRWAALVLAIASAGVQPEASAQSATGTGSIELEEIVVTARRREESMQDVPISITAMSGEKLREQNVNELADIALHVPSMNVSSGGPNTTIPVVSLRGQRPSDVTITLDAAVPMYFADIVLTPSYATNLAIYDLESVQVLKGPQGTLFGRNSTGGALLFTPQAPGSEFGGYADVKLGDYNLVQLEGGVDVPVSDTLQVRVSGRKVERDGYQSNVAQNALHGRDKYWDEDSYGLRLVARYTPTERLMNLATVSFDQNDMLSRIAVPHAFNASVPQLGQLVDIVHNGYLNTVVGGLFGTPEGRSIDEAIARQAARSPWKIESDTAARDKVENLLFANKTEFEIADGLMLRNILGYRNLDMDTINDADGTAVPLFGAVTSTTANVTPDPNPGFVEVDQYSEELQLLGTAFDERLDWIAGAYWMRMEGSQSLPIQVVGVNPAWPSTPSPVGQLDPIWAIAQNGILQDSPAGDAENEAWAVFGEGTWTFNDQWSLTAGLRQTWDKREMTAKNRANDTTSQVLHCSMTDEAGVLLPDDACERTVDEDYDRMTWRMSLNWSPVDDMMLYGSVSTGYRAGGFNMRGTNNFTLQPFNEETVTTYEIGHKTDWHLGALASLRTNLAVYLQKYDDIQKTVSAINPDTGGFETYTINAAKADIQGLEFDVIVAPTDALLATVSWSYVDAEYTKWPREVSPGVIVDYTKAQFGWIPENSLTGTLQYTLPLDASLGEVSLMASVYYQDKVSTNESSWRWPTLGWAADDLAEALASAEADSYTVWNFRLDWQGVMGSLFDLALFVNNATDEEYITGGLHVQDSLGWAGATYGPPKTWGASLRYSF